MYVCLIRYFIATLETRVDINRFIIDDGRFDALTTTVLEIMIALRHYHSY